VVFRPKPVQTNDDFFGFLALTSVELPMNNNVAAKHTSNTSASFISLTSLPRQA
jgi:hypothetical protein